MKRAYKPSVDRPKQETSMSQIFVLSIETTQGVSHQYGFHLGTDEYTARRIVAEKFAAWQAYSIPVVTMALMRGGAIFDVYYGDKWQSEIGGES